MSDAAPPAIVVRGLVKHYSDAGRTIRVLDGVDLDIAPGEKIAIVGESGVGKSTLLHLLGALDAPTAGTIVHGDRDISKLDARALAAFRNSDVGFVFQFHHLMADL